MVQKIASAITLGTVALNVASGLALPITGKKSGPPDVLGREVSMLSGIDNVSERRESVSTWDNSLALRAVQVHGLDPRDPSSHSLMSYAGMNRKRGEGEAASEGSESSGNKGDQLTTQSSEPNKDKEDKEDKKGSGSRDRLPKLITDFSGSGQQKKTDIPKSEWYGSPANEGNSGSPLKNVESKWFGSPTAEGNSNSPLRDAKSQWFDSPTTEKGNSGSSPKDEGNSHPPLENVKRQWFG